MKERNALQIEHDALTATQNETASTLQETMLLHQKAAATIETHDQHVQKVTKKMVNIYFFTLTTLQNQKKIKKIHSSKQKLIIFFPFFQFFSFSFCVYILCRMIK